MPPRLVHQRHDNGCAIAAIASYLGVGYDNVLRRAFPDRNRVQLTRERTLALGLTPHRMARVIRSYGHAAYVYDGLPESLVTDLNVRPAILMFDWAATFDGVEGRHAVVWLPSTLSSGPTVLDPGYNVKLSTSFYVNRWEASGRVSILLG